VTLGWAGKEYHPVIKVRGEAVKMTDEAEKPTTD
jgi:hypothetical protein